MFCPQKLGLVALKYAMPVKIGIIMPGRNENNEGLKSSRLKDFRPWIGPYITKIDPKYCWTCCEHADILLKFTFPKISSIATSVEHDCGDPWAKLQAIAASWVKLPMMPMPFWCFQTIRKVLSHWGSSKTSNVWNHQSSDLVTMWPTSHWYCNAAVQFTKH